MPPTPPPPPPPSSFGGSTSTQAATPPFVPSSGPAGSLLVELFIYNGTPFKDHWAYFIQSSSKSSVGVIIHATGDVRNGFQFEIKRSYNLDTTSRKPSRIPLQWVDPKYFNEGAMLNHGVFMFDAAPVCPFEEMLYQVQVPGKSLNNMTDRAGPQKKIVPRDCQTWIVESADRLVVDCIFGPEVVEYLRAIQQ